MVLQMCVTLKPHTVPMLILQKLPEMMRAFGVCAKSEQEEESWAQQHISSQE